MSVPLSHRIIGVLLFIHYFYTLLILHYDYGPIIGKYQGLWICSVSLLLTGAGMIIGRGGMVAVGLISVSTGHCIWTIDTLWMIYK